MAVGENDLHPVLKTVPVAWRDKIGLLQNELLPRDWLEHKIENPTVIAVWFEKKKGQDFKVLVPSPVFGPSAPLIESALESLDIPCWELTDKAELDFELVRKNVYILTTNISGLVVGGTVDELWNKHQDLARQVADEVMDIQACWWVIIWNVNDSSTAWWRRSRAICNTNVWDAPHLRAWRGLSPTPMKQI